MTPEEALLQAVCEQPDDQLTWLAYADWLEERADPRSRYLRAEVELRQLPEATVHSAALEAELQELRASLEPRWLRRIEAALFAERHCWGGFEDIVWAVTISPDSRYVLGGGGGDCLDGTWVPGSDYAVRLWDARSGQELARLAEHPGAVSSLQCSPDGRLVHFNSGDTIRVWDVIAVTEEAPFTDAGSVAALSLSGDGRLLLSGGWDRTVRLWDVATRRELRRFEGHTGRVWDVALSPDGRQAASCGDESVIRVWDVASGEEERQIWGHDNYVVRVVFSPDGTKLLSGAWDNTARLWRARNGEQIQVFVGHEGRVEGATFSPGGRRVLTGSLDKTVRLWEAATGKEVHRFEGHTAPVARVAISADGRFAASAGWDKTVRTWRLAGAPPRS
jgi:uncharacterized protein (TIGR02996 family)